MKHIDGDTPVIATEADIILKKVIAQARKAGIPVSDNIDKNIVINKRAKTRLGACRMKKNGRKKHFTIEIGSALLVCGHEEIAEVIATKYGMLLDGSTYSVNQATLYYMENKMNDKQYEVIPVWIFNTEDKETGKTLQDIVNAETGKEIIWEEK